MLRGDVCRVGGKYPGFTLIELLVTLTLLGFLIALGLPAFTAMVKNTQVRTVADALQNGIRLARSEALRQNRQTVFWLTNAAPAQDVAAVAGGRNWGLQTVPTAADSGASYIQGGALADVATGVAIGSTVSAICFNSNGRLTVNASPGPTGASCAVPAGLTTYNITQTSADRPLRVTVSVGGQVRVCDPNRSLSTAFDGC